MTKKKMDIEQYQISCYDIKRKKYEKYYEWGFGIALLLILVIAGVAGLLD